MNLAFLLALWLLAPQNDQGDKYMQCDIPQEIVRQVVLNGAQDVSCGSWTLAFTSEGGLSGDAAVGWWTVVASTNHPSLKDGYPVRTYHLMIADSGGMGSGWDAVKLTYEVRGFDEKTAAFKRDHPDCKELPCHWKTKNCEGTEYSPSGWGMAICNFKVEDTK